MMLAHNVHDVQSFKRHIHSNRMNGIDNEWLTPQQAKEYCPPLDIATSARYPVMGAALQRRGGVARHDAVAWGYARAAAARSDRMMLAHNVHDVQSFKRHIHSNRMNGIDNEWLTPQQAKEYCPPLDIATSARYPVMGAALQRRGGVARHDAVAWGYARAAAAR